MSGRSAIGCSSIVHVKFLPACGTMVICLLTWSIAQNWYFSADTMNTSLSRMPQQYGFHPTLPCPRRQRRKPVVGPQLLTQQRRPPRRHPRAVAMLG